ncbi:MAG: small basic family protein [Clostridiales bacterium]|nr:small basic family protein [Clostridiales bacterium]
MLVAIIGLVLGVIIGLFLPNFYPAEYSFYISIAVLAALDSIFGAVRSNMEGRFDMAIFISGFLGNAVLAGALAFIGDKMGVPLYYAAIFVFGGRLFQNFAVIRRLLIDKYFRKK